MVNESDLFYKCNFCTKVDAGIKKSNKTETKSWGKKSTNEKSIKKDVQQLIKQI